MTHPPSQDPSRHRKRRRLSNFQIICLVVLWFALVYLVFTQAVEITGPLVVSVAISGALVFIPIYKEFRKRKKD